MEDLCTPVSGSNIIAAYSLPLVNPVLYSDTDPNTSSKTIIVPASTIWQLISIFVIYKSTNTAEDRQLRIYFQDPSDTSFLIIVPHVKIPTNTSRYFSFFPSAPLDTSAHDNYFVTTPLPQLTLPPLHKMFFYESDEIDTEADDMEIHILFNQINI